MTTPAEVTKLKSMFPFNVDQNLLAEEAFRRGSIRKFRPGQTIFFQNERAEWVALVLDGAVSEMTNREFAGRCSALYETGTYFGIESVNDDANYQADYVSRNVSTVLFWKYSDRKLIENSFPIFKTALAKMAAAKEIERTGKVLGLENDENALYWEKESSLGVAVDLGKIFLLLLFALAGCFFGFNFSRIFILLGCLLVCVAVCGAVYRIIRSKQKSILITNTHVRTLKSLNGAIDQSIRLNLIRTVNVQTRLFSSFQPYGDIVFTGFRETLSVLNINSPEHIRRLLLSIHKNESMTHDGKNVNQQDTTLFSDSQLSLGKEPVPNQGLESLQKQPDSLTELIPDMEETQLYVYRAHWARLAVEVVKPLLIILLVSAFIISGTRGDWLLFSYPIVVPLCVAMIGFCLLLILYQLFDWWHDLYIIEQNAIKDVRRKPFSSEVINAAMMNKIQSVRFAKNGLFQLLLNYGTLIILVGEGELYFHYVPQPEKVQKIILEQVEAYDKRDKIMEHVRQREFVAELWNKINTGNNPH